MHLFEYSVIGNVFKTHGGCCDIAQSSKVDLKTRNFSSICANSWAPPYLMSTKHWEWSFAIHPLASPVGDCDAGSRLRSIVTEFRDKVLS
jgi:hypothetical protein